MGEPDRAESRRDFLRKAAAPTNAVVCCGDCTYPGSGFGCFCVEI